MRFASSIICVCLAVFLLTTAAQGLSFSVDQPPSGTAYNDGVLLIYSTQLGPAPDATSMALVETPVDALHVGDPVSGLMSAVYVGDGIWEDFALTGGLLFSLDSGDPFPIGVQPDTSEEVRISYPPGTPGVTAQGWNMGLAGDTALATEENMGLGPNAAFDDDVDALDTVLQPVPDQQVVFFSVDDHITLVPNLPTDMRTCDIYARLADGSIIKVIDGVTELGLVHQGDGTEGVLVNDDVDAMILVDLDGDSSNNIVKEIQYQDPTGAPKVAVIDLGDGILFSLDREMDLPYQGAGTIPTHFQPSLPTDYVYFSSYTGATPDNVISHTQLGLGVDICCDVQDIDALAAGEIPEPGTLLLVGTVGLGVLGLVRRRRIRA